MANIINQRAQNLTMTLKVKDHGHHVSVVEPFAVMKVMKYMNDLQGLR